MYSKIIAKILNGLIIHEAMIYFWICLLKNLYEQFHEIF